MSVRCATALAIRCHVFCEPLSLSLALLVGDEITLNPVRHEKTLFTEETMCQNQQMLEGEENVAQLEFISLPAEHFGLQASSSAKTFKIISFVVWLPQTKKPHIQHDNANQNWKISIFLSTFHVSVHFPIRAPWGKWQWKTKCAHWQQTKRSKKVASNWVAENHKTARTLWTWASESFRKMWTLTTHSLSLVVAVTTCWWILSIRNVTQNVSRASHSLCNWCTSHETSVSVCGQCKWIVWCVVIVSTVMCHCWSMHDLCILSWRCEQHSCNFETNCHLLFVTRWAATQKRQLWLLLRMKTMTTLEKHQSPMVFCDRVHACHQKHSNKKGKWETENSKDPHWPEIIWKWHSVWKMGRDMQMWHLFGFSVEGTIVTDPDKGNLWLGITMNMGQQHHYLHQMQLLLSRKDMCQVDSTLSQWRGTRCRFTTGPRSYTRKMNFAPVSLLFSLVMIIKSFVPRLCVL